MQKKYAYFIIILIFVITFILISQRALDLLSNTTTSLRMSNSSIYGIGCPENPFHSRLETLFRTWISIAKRRNITYFVCYGALLGLNRDADVVPFDNDLDVCIFRKELHKLESEDEPKPFKVADGKPHLIYQKHCHHPKVDTLRKTCEGVEVKTHVDQCTFLDPCARIVLRHPSSSQTTWLDVFALRDNVTYFLDDFKGKNHRRDIILPLKPCVFMGISTVCPNNVTGYLKRYYGNNFLTNSHYVCKNGEWVATDKNVKFLAVPRCPETDRLCHIRDFLYGIRKKLN